ncbi:MAG: hypothetical protein JWO52_4088 [Gammaproteobacteria bacterium]|nr:hypothetical protein [Gammaproteobacteria bacterium]
MSTQPMDADTLTALRGSIAKWRAIVDGTGADQRSVNCPLCEKFLDREDEDGNPCQGCPVAKRTGDWGCGGTPYVDNWALLVAVADQDNAFATTEAMVAAAQAELAFLIELLPEGEAP